MAEQTFQGRYEVINGKRVLVIKANVEEKINSDGSKDVIVHAPSLSLINKMKEENTNG